MTVLAWAEHAARMFEPTSTEATWAEVARPEQLPPLGDWQTWLILAGRGWGKTRTGTEYIADLARTYPGARIALVAATFADGRDTMVEGESGLLAVLDDSELKGGNQDEAWNRSMGELFMKNGSRFKIYPSERPRQLRGPQHHFAWCDEAAAWLDAAKGTSKDTTWSNLLFGLRLPGQKTWPAGYRTRIVVTTTPRPVPLIKVPDSVAEREPHRAGIIQRPSTVTTRGKTSDNLANLSEEFRKEVIDPIPARPSPGRSSTPRSSRTPTVPCCRGRSSTGTGCSSGRSPRSPRPSWRSTPRPRRRSHRTRPASS